MPFCFYFEIINLSSKNGPHSFNEQATSRCRIFNSLVFFIVPFIYLFIYRLGRLLYTWTAPCLRQLEGNFWIGFLLPPCGSQGLDLDSQAWRQMSSLAEPPSLPRIFNSLLSTLIVCIVFLFDAYAPRRLQHKRNGYKTYGSKNVNGKLPYEFQFLFITLL